MSTDNWFCCEYQCSRFKTRLKENIFSEQNINNNELLWFFAGTVIQFSTALCVNYFLSTCRTNEHNNNEYCIIRSESKGLTVRLIRVILHAPDHSYWITMSMNSNLKRQLILSIYPFWDCVMLLLPIQFDSR